MSRKYFLDDGVEYLPDSGELFVDDHLENLQSLENKLLLHFVSHPNQLISKEDLYHVGWAGRIYGDNPLSKAISTLRSKLRDNPRAPRYIKTIPKKGFRFVSQVSEQPIEVTILVPQDSLKRPFPNVPIRLFSGSVMIIFIWAAMSIFIKQTAQPSGLQISNVQQITHTNGQEKDPNLSKDGQLVVFSRQLSLDTFAQIVIKPLKGGTEKTITQNNYHHLTPKWHTDGKHILYHRFSPQRCEIALITLNIHLDVSSDQVLTQCGAYNKTLGLSWGPDNSIYYTDIDIQFAAQKIYQLDINTSKRILVAAPSNTEGRGYYRVHYDNRSHQLFAILNNDWYQSNVVTLNQQGEIIQQHLINYPLFSVSSYQGEPVFKTQGNHIHSLRDGQEQRLMQSPLWPIFSPDFVESEQQHAMVFVGGVLNNAELVLIDLATQQETVLSRGDVSHKFPKMSLSNTLYYISNRSGVYQVWKTYNGESEQLTRFDSNLYIEDIAVSKDENYIAITTSDLIYVYQLNNTPLQLEYPYTVIENSVNPHFSPDSKTLWSSRENNGIYEMNALTLADKQIHSTPIKNAFLGMFDQHTQQHFAFKLDQQGIWQIEDGQLVWFKHSPIINSARSALLNNHHLTYYSDDKAKVMQLSLENNQTIELIDAPYRYVSSVAGKSQQIVVTRKKFGNTNIYLVEY